METQFRDLGLSETTLRALERMHFNTPTIVQSKAIPPAMEKRDIAISAQTGTGKTAAFGVPIVERISARKSKTPSALILTPTRELAQQIDSFLFALTKSSGHRITTLIGGTPYGPQIKRLRQGTDILIATPGRLVDMMDRRLVNLSDVEILVLDEADRMLDMGFWPAMQKIIPSTPSSRQTMLFSATLDRKLLNTVGTMMKDPLLIEVSHKGDTAEGVTQFVVPVSQKRKPELLRTVLKERGSERVIVFARTKSRSDSCTELLCQAGYQAEAIHSDKSQGQRKRALDNFRKGKTNILVATDVLARGIHVTDVKHVINYDLPDCADDYVHRIGRTGRAGKKGDAVSFVSSDSKSALRDIETLVGKTIPNIDLEGFDSSVDTFDLRSKSGGSNGGGRKFSGKRPYNRSGSSAGNRKGRPGAQSSGKPGGQTSSKPGSQPSNRSNNQSGNQQNRKVKSGKYAAKVSR